MQTRFPLFRFFAFPIFHHLFHAAGPAAGHTTLRSGASPVDRARRGTLSGAELVVGSASHQSAGARPPARQASAGFFARSQGSARVFSPGASGRGADPVPNGPASASAAAGRLQFHQPAAVCAEGAGPRAGARTQMAARAPFRPARALDAQIPAMAVSAGQLFPRRTFRT